MILHFLSLTSTINNSQWWWSERSCNAFVHLFDLEMVDCYDENTNRSIFLKKKKIHNNHAWCLHNLKTRLLFKTLSRKNTLFLFFGCPYIHLYSYSSFESFQSCILYSLRRSKMHRKSVKRMQRKSRWGHLEPNGAVYKSKRW